MPIYEYQCTSCNHHFDLMQKVSDDPVKQCPVCYKDTVIKLISAAGFQLKGTGWYATDFKNKASKTPETKAKNDDSAPAEKTKDTSSSKTTQDGDNK
ncbi:zinc ribbon domain-containing protein [Fluoribacter dumoffii]|uniref:Putative regulatory protein, FmdB family n=1 Tax=Fluoribacter dumoffii TaxID=463 RepID=A0A377G9I6_9GAMM|nr:zinc ribbon domain-containing protein [Fluoribacter dumoffii]KTC90356.1 Zinc ribbon domain protein [Fluoribacter dumoffii NY 23]MCW8385673.1 zinc ribbon domain-containing protein [Fluoribacter dumoffii]MCW8418703.1 zinc ribbon domain-containing protein [Fluoribacter dumoffii]MCW8453453.1 zinc ribbon domain-containing protein [Fluoribacter dumoffii]MCW8459327.1 zinc ribbon domain-containing protein [Fluoribacter dumoffii]